MGGGRSGPEGTFPIAVVGVACRFPGASDVAEFWSLLHDGIDAVGPIPEDRWDVAANYSADPNRPGKMYTRDGGFIADIDRFDAAFFGISPREARRIDPQQRILLELTWEAMEDAGIVPGRLAGSQAGVFVGISFSDYAALQREDPDHVDAYVMSGSAVSNAANRISYIFDLHGPSFAVDTACSSSLVAIHEACVSLWRGESSLAIAGGINVLLSASGFIGFSKAHMLSPTGRCHAFDASGDGYVRAEGGGVVLLQPLDRAIAEGNPIWAVIAGSGVNSDGRTTGLAMPNPAAQEALLRRIYRDAGIDPGAVAYVEAHGTGTSVGDPVECTALGRVFGTVRPPGEPCRIGSVKTNIGHLEPASGIAGLLKVLLAMRHRAIPRSLHLVKPNPNIPFAELNLSVVSETVALPPGPVVMGVNSFGFGGTNAHVIVRSPDSAALPAPPPAGATPAAPRPLLISAHTSEALHSLAGRYAALLRSPDAPALPAVRRNAATRRTHHAHRLAVIGERADEIADRLAAYAAGDAAPMLVESQGPAAPARLAFVFSGNGSQWRGMGRDLSAEPLIADWLARIDAELRPHLGWSVAEVLRSTEPENLYDRTEYAQPALFALQVAIVEWLRAHGVEAEAMAGHSVGEVAAAYAAGMLPLEAACKVIAVRSQAQGRTAGAGRMAAVGLAAEDAAAAIRAYGERLTIAGINSPRSVTVAGDADALAALGEDLRPGRTFFRELALDYAFHSRVMDPIRGELLERLDGLAPQPGHHRFLSTVTGSEIGPGRLGPDYWWDNIRKPVLFAAAVEALADEGFTAFLEIGPHPILDAYVRECTRARGDAVASLATLRRREPERDALWLALGRCYTAGVPIDFDALYQQDTGFVPLPAYPWQRERYWFSDGEDGATSARERKHPLLGKRLPTAEPIWKHRLNPSALWWLGDHVVQGSVVVPGAAYIEMALAAAASATGGEAIEIEGFEIRRPIVVPPGSEPAVEIGLSTGDGSFQLHAGEAAGGNLPPVVVARATALASRPPTATVSPQALRERMRQQLDRSAVYQRFAEHGLAYGPAFQGIAETWTGDGEALGHIAAPAAVEAECADYCIHPAILDACLQVTLAAVPADIGGSRAALVPAKADRIRFHGGAGAIAWCHVRIVKTGARSIVADFTMFDDRGAVVAEIAAMRFRRLEFGGAGEIPAYHWRFELRPASGGPATADDLPAPADLLAALATAGEDPRLGAARTALDRVAAAYAHAAISEFAEGDGVFAPPPSRANGAGPPPRERLIGGLLALLEQAGLAERRGRQWQLSADGSLAAAEASWRAALLRHPAQLPSLQLIARCGEALPALLRAADASADAAAADRQDDILDQLYDADPLFRGAATAAAGIVGAVGRMLPATRLLRVLEIAGGSGGLTGALLAALPAERAEYVFTDADEGTVARAEARFAGISGFRGRALDLAKDPAEQGFDGARYDIVVAGATLAAAADARHDLATIARLVKPGGLLITLKPEGGGFLDLAAMTAPGLARAFAADWAQAVAEAGFGEVTRAGPIILGRKPSPATAPVLDEAEPAVWVVVSSDALGDAAAALTRRVERIAQRVVLVEDGARYERLGLNRFRAPAGDRGSYARVLQLLAADGAARFYLVYLRGLAARDAGDPLTQDRSFDLLTVVQGVVAAGLGAATRLSVATAGAIAANDSGGAARPWQATLWGVGRGVMNERSDIACRLIDLDPAAATADAIAALGDELLRPDDEDEIALRGSGRYAPRLTRGLPVPVPADGGGHGDAFTLAFGHGEAQDRTTLHRIAMPRPGAGEVTARVEASGVNFRDVLQRIGLLPEEAFESGFAGPTLGLEFSGEVVAVGDGVEHLRPGDAVFGFGRSAFSSHLVAPAFSLFKKPEEVSFAEAATVPVAAVTVYYSLHHLARLARGERILIHGAAGGVGLAAVQYAQSVGAEIFASAGSPEKRALLRRLGVTHMVDSRTLAFADDIRAMTGGEGVDVVLNSLAGEAIHKGISLLRPYGRFVELGKRDFYANSKLGLQPFRHNIQFFGVDVDTLLVDRPALARQLFEELTPLLDRGVFSPLPHRVYPIARAAEAFRSMQQSRHIGKIIVAMTETEGLVPVPAPGRTQLRLPPDATYLVTGGRGGFGLATAQWLARRGGRHLALIGRSQTTAPDAAVAIERLRKDGVDVREFSADVADDAQLARVLEQIRRTMPPLRGIIHAAAVIRDVSLVNETEENFREVVRPKIAGAWNLHRRTLTEALDFFVMYSSAITLFGNEGQANYAAANLYLESLAAHRRGSGLPGLAIAWGAIADVGHMARNTGLTERVQERLGVRTLAPGRALDRLADAIASGTAQAALAEMSWSRLARMTAIARAPKYAPVRNVLDEEPVEGGGSSAEELRAHLAGLPRDEAVAAVQQLLVKHIAGVVGTAPAKLATDLPLTDLGMDSLMLVELQLGLDKQFGISIPTLDLMDLATVAKLARRIVDEIGSAPEAEPNHGATEPPNDLPAIEDLTEPAFELTVGRLLGQELDRAKERTL